LDNEERKTGTPGFWQIILSFGKHWWQCFAGLSTYFTDKFFHLA